MMAGLAAAFGGFAQGYGQGAKLRSDLEDAEERRGLARTQKESLVLENEKKKREAEYEAEKKQVLESLLNPKQAVQTTAPPADQENLPEYERGQPGIRVPGQGGMFDNAKGGAVNDFATLTKLQNAMTELDAKHGKLSVKDLLDNAKRYTELQKEGVMDAWQQVAAGNYQGAFDTFNSTGKYRLPEGTRFEARQEDDGFGTGRKITNYYAIAPDGREVNYRDMMRNTIAPEKLAELDSATGYRIADLGLKRTAEENAARRHTELYKLTELKYDRLIGEQKAQTSIALERLNLVKDDAKYQKTQSAFTGAFGELSNALGINKRYDPTLASEADKREHGAKLLAASGAQSIFEMNYDLGKNAAGVTPQQALNAWKMAAADPGIVRIDQETGFGYIEQGKKKVYVPGTMAPQQPQSQPGGAPGQPSRSASGAIRTPRVEDSDGTLRPPAPAGLRTPYGPQRYQPQSVTTPFNPD